MFLRARYLDPAQGRFTSRDTWEGDYAQPLSLNAWNYTDSNPVNYTDPNGLCSGGVGDDELWQGLNRLDAQGFAQMGQGWDKLTQQCRANLNKAQAAWQRGDFVRAAAWGSGATTALQRFTGWIYDFNDDMAIFRNRYCSQQERVEAGLGVLGRGFEAATVIVNTGYFVKGFLSLATRRAMVQAEVQAERELAERETSGLLGTTKRLEGEGLATGERRLGTEGSELAEKNAGRNLGDAVGVFCSFSEDTLVATDNGEQPISTLQVGDQVWAYDESLGTTGTYTVTAVLQHTDPLVAYVTIDGERIETTPEHPFYTQEAGWLAAG